MATMATLSRADLRNGVRHLVQSGEAQRRREATGPRGEAARRLDIDPITLYRWETGRREPQGRNLNAYARFLERLGADLREAATGAIEKQIATEPRGGALESTAPRDAIGAA